MPSLLILKMVILAAEEKPADVESLIDIAIQYGKSYGVTKDDVISVLYSPLIQSILTPNVGVNAPDGIETLRKRATCACGDVFTEAEPGKCCNCVAADGSREISRLIELCQSAHDRLLRGDSDGELLAILEQAWKKTPNG